jgi:hypothetical protein
LTSIAIAKPMAFRLKKFIFVHSMLIMNLLTYLKQPFPKAEGKWRIIFLISLFVALFLIVFQPFGINMFHNENKYLILAGYGMVTFCTLVVNLLIIENIFIRIFDERRWVIWKEFVWLLWIIFSIGLGNAFYTSIVFAPHFNADISFYISFQLITLAVGVIPIAILIITKYSYLTSKYSNSAKTLSKNIDHKQLESKENVLVKLFADNRKDFFEIPAVDILFVESMGNYINLHYLEDNNPLRKTLRNTIKNTQQFFTNTPQIIQCHRAYIVNIDKIIGIKGNSQGLRVKLSNCDTEVPVSRTYVDIVRRSLVE